MKKKTGKAYFNELWELMVAHLDSFLKTGDQEKLHQFRLQVKKLRAFLLLLDSARSKNTLSKDFKPVKGIFKQGGAIREAYINLQLSANYGLKNEEFVLTQLNAMERGINEFKGNAKKNLKTIKMVYEQLEDKLDTIGDDNINEFYKMQLGQIDRGLDAAKFDDLLHTCRTKIKTLLYNRKIAAKALEGKLDIDIAYLDKLQGRIGDWHDNTLAMELFSTLEGIDNAIIIRIKKEDTRLKKAINTLAHDFWKKTVLMEEDLNKAPLANA